MKKLTPYQLVEEIRQRTLPKLTSAQETERARLAKFPIKIMERPHDTDLLIGEIFFNNIDMGMSRIYQEDLSMEGNQIELYTYHMRNNLELGYTLIHEFAHVVSLKAHVPDWAKTCEQLGIIIKGYELNGREAINHADGKEMLSPEYWLDKELYSWLKAQPNVMKGFVP